ncbi:MAG: trypsin-like peptidase domain-containing protein [Thermomicrobiales bacterium]|jgi:serine protease Do|nr:trypsin-like peptidase domain-containing protein [Thermomicrobiales bacterium]
MSTILDTIPGATAGGLLSQLDADLEAIYQKVRKSVVLLYRNGGNGAGVIWRNDGTIITNNHVVSGDGQMNVVLADGRTFLGIVARRHPTRDLAIVKIVETGLPAIDVADSTKVRAGEIALAIGHPLGYRDAVTAGIVVASGNSREAEGHGRGDVIQTDARFAPGVSGGPLVNHRGEAIGIATRVSGELGLAVPSSAVQAFVGSDGRQGRGRIGCRTQLVPLRGHDWNSGLLVTRVREDGPADTAGLILGDVIVDIDGHIIEDQETLPATIMRAAPDTPVQLTVLRGGAPMSLSIIPAFRSDSESDEA